MVVLDEQEPGRHRAVMEKPVFCASCGAALKPGARFCESCGKPVAIAPVEAKAIIPETAAAPAASQAVGQRSPDGKWWWDGTQWVAMKEAAAPVIEVAAAGQAKKGKGRGKFILLGLGVAVVALVGILIVTGELSPNTSTYKPTYTPAIGAGPYYLHYNCGGDATCMSDPQISEGTGNGNNTGILLDFASQTKCQAAVTQMNTTGGNYWCSTSKNPGDTGP